MVTDGLVCDRLCDSSAVLADHTRSEALSTDLVFTGQNFEVLTEAMASWYLNKALSNWRNAINARFPNRDKASDGTIGDTAHQNTVSDHNPDLDGSVDAFDMDVDGVDVELCKSVFQGHPAARYWIHNRQIANHGTGWKRQTYTGSNPHTAHVHWNSEPTQENNNTPWVFPGGSDMAALQDNDINYVVALWRLEALASGSSEAIGGPLTGEKIWTVAQLKAIDTQLKTVVQTIARLETQVNGLDSAEVPELDYNKLAVALLQAMAQN